MSKIDAINESIHEHFCVTTKELKGRSQKRHIAEARMAAMVLVEKATGLRPTVIGHLYGKPDGDCLPNARMRVKSLYDTDRLFKRSYDRVEAEIQKTPQDLS